MSKLSRYNLLISLIRYELKYEHVLTSSSDVQHNQLLYRRSIEAWIFLADDLMRENLISEQARDTRIKNLITFLNQTDTSLALNLLKKVYDVLLNHISFKKQLTDYIDFKDQFSKHECTGMGYLLSPIKEPLALVLQSQTVVRSGCYQSPATKAMRSCAYYLQFLTKINFSGVGLEEKGLQDYLLYEQETSELDLQKCKVYIPALRKKLTRWLAHWTYNGNSSKHGPGSVADADRDKISKYLAFKSDCGVRALYEDIDTLSTVIPFGGLVRPLERTSRLVFVPKNITKLRSISMEPATLQYLQQGCMDSLYKYFENHAYLSRILKLQDQSQNQSFAYDGSITNNYATIDLSHASDSVNWKLVKSLFRDLPQLRKWLVCTRSTHTLLPNGQRLSLTKFAPMGSALCFPVESLIFAAIASLAIDISREKALDRNVDTGIRSSITTFTVYGDDIILPTYAAKQCIELLILFGFTPNNEKSYLDGPFKESCGGNYYCGLDITAIKFAPDFDSKSPFGVGPNAYSALCSYANLAYERGLSQLRLYCIKLIFEAGLKPYFTDQLDTSPAIYSPNPTNFHLKRIYRKRYQKYQYLYTGVESISIREKQYNWFKCLNPLGRETTVSHVEHIFLFDFLHQKKDEESNPYLSQQNASIRNGVLTFDVNTRYARSTLLPQEFKYSRCLRDC